MEEVNNEFLSKMEGFKNELDEFINNCGSEAVDIVEYENLIANLWDLFYEDASTNSIDEVFDLLGEMFNEEEKDRFVKKLFLERTFNGTVDGDICEYLIDVFYLFDLNKQLSEAIANKLQEIDFNFENEIPDDILKHFLFFGEAYFSKEFISKILANGIQPMTEGGNVLYLANFLYACKEKEFPVELMGILENCDLDIANDEFGSFKAFEENSISDKLMLKFLKCIQENTDECIQENTDNSSSFIDNDSKALLMNRYGGEHRDKIQEFLNDTTTQTRRRMILARLESQLLNNTQENMMNREPELDDRV